MLEKFKSTKPAAKVLIVFSLFLAPLIVLGIIVGGYYAWEEAKLKQIIATTNDYSVEPEKNTEVEAVLAPMLGSNIQGSGESYSVSADQANLNIFPSWFLTDVKVDFTEDKCTTSYSGFSTIGLNKIDSDSNFWVEIKTGEETYEDTQNEEYLFTAKKLNEKELSDFSRGDIEDEQQQVGDISSLPFTVPQKLLEKIPNLNEWYYVKATKPYLAAPFSWHLGGDASTVVALESDYPYDILFCNVRLLPYYTDIVETETSPSGEKRTVLAFNREKYQDFNGWYTIKTLKERGVDEEEIQGTLLYFDERMGAELYDTKPLDLPLTISETVGADGDLYDNIRYVIEETGNNTWIFTYYNAAGEKVYQYFWESK